METPTPETPETSLEERWARAIALALDWIFRVNPHPRLEAVEAAEGRDDHEGAGDD